MDIWYRRYTSAGFPTPINQWTGWYRSVMEQTDNTFASGTFQNFLGQLGMDIQTGVTIPTGGSTDGVITYLSTYPPVIELASGQDQEVVGMRINQIEVGTVVIIRNSATVRVFRHYGVAADTIKAPFNFIGWGIEDWVMPRYGFAAFRLHDTGFDLEWRPIWLCSHGGTQFRTTDAIYANTTMQGHATKIDANLVHVSGELNINASVSFTANTGITWLPDHSSAPGGGNNNYNPTSADPINGANFTTAVFNDNSAGTYTVIPIWVQSSGQIRLVNSLSAAIGDRILFDFVYTMNRSSDTMPPIP